MIIAIIILAYLLVNTWLSLIMITKNTLLVFDELPLVLLMTILNPFVYLAIGWLVYKIKKMITKAHRSEKISQLEV